MKEQKLITGSNSKDFAAEVNDLLDDGWKVVSGTNCCAVSAVLIKGSFNSRIEREELFSVVLEKAETKEINNRFNQPVELAMN